MSLAEVIVASAVVLLVFVILISANSIYYKTAAASLKSVKATYLLEEGQEAVIFLKNSDWTNFPAAGATSYYFRWTGTTWQATTTSALIDNAYQRAFVVSSVNRDGNDNIVSTGGSLDQNTKKVSVLVTWSDAGSTTTKSISAYITKP